MHLSFKNLNPTPTKNLLSKFQNLYIYANGLCLSIESLLHLMFLFFFFELQLTHMYLYWNDIHVVRFIEVDNL